jgi:NodT family efflux transporter outer membrane factor (OMF) lipoprotein
MKTIHLIQDRRNYFSPAVLLAVFVGGCAVGPDYKKPAVSAPTQWSESAAGVAAGRNASETAWWKTFHDPELDSLVDRATAANLDLKVAAARVREARAQYGAAKADFWPTVDGTGSFAREQESKHQPLIGQIPLPAGIPFTSNVYQAGFDASWELDVFGGTRRATEAARAEVESSEFSRRNVLISLLGEVARNYVEVRALQRRLAIARENIQAQSEALAIASDRYQKGAGVELDVKQAAALLASTQAQVPSLTGNLEAAVHRLGVLLAQPPGTLKSELSAPAPIPAAPPEVPAGLPSDLLTRRPDIQQAERELAAATARIGVAKSDWFPKFSLNGDIGAQSVSTSDWFTPGSKFWSFGPTMQWRIFDAGRIRANVEVQNARQEQALETYEQTVLLSFEDVENALAAYANDQIRRQSLTEAARDDQDSVVLARKLYVNGLTPFINVIDAERSLYQAQDDLVQSDRSVTQDVIALYKALGGGWENGAADKKISIGMSSPQPAPGKVASAAGHEKPICLNL